MDILQVGLVASSIAVGYVLGSTPVAYMVARSQGVDIFEVGTRNPGAANVFRVVGRFPGTLVVILDALKGLLAVSLANILGVMPEATVVAGAAAVVGHWYPAFLRFKGGAGLATAIGAGIGLAPVPGLIALLLALLALLMIRSSGHSAAVGYVGFASFAPFLGTAWPEILGASLLVIIVLLRSIVVETSRDRRDEE